MGRIIGIDPGLTGALALLEGGELIAIEDMPTFRIGKKTAIDHWALARIIDRWNDVTGPASPPAAWIEFVSSSPQMGVTSAFSFGKGYGIILGILAANFIPMHFVTPPSWKTAMKAKGEKDESRARAKALWPARSDWFSLVKHHGRADAALIGLYGAESLRRAA